MNCFILIFVLSFDFELMIPNLLLVRFLTCDSRPDFPAVATLYGASKRKSQLKFLIALKRSL